MTTAPDTTLDCIIFGLQRFGGISNYWARLVAAAAEAETATNCTLLLPQQIRYADYRAEWTGPTAIRRERLSPRVARYLDVPMAAATGVFHTSYYRVPRGRVGKYVVSAYDFIYERYRDGPARWVHTAQKLRSIRRADLVLCISDSTRRDIIEYCPDVDPAKLQVVHLGVDTELFHPDPPPPTVIEPGTVLFVGQRDGYKRFDLAVKAVEQCPRLSLGIVGPALGDDERTALQRSLGRRWREFGPVRTEQLRSLYSAAYAFVFPSDYEGFGLPVLEAMACGCPVVAAAKSSLPEVGGSAALYADTQDAAAYAAELLSLDSETTRAEVVRAGFARAREFPWSHTLQRTFALHHK